MNGYTTPTEILDRHADELPDAVVDRAREMLEDYDADRYGSAPSGVAAGAVYAAGLMEGRRINQSDVADLFGVSEGTIRGHYRDAYRAG